jgi:hypothetical protein
LREWDQWAQLSFNPSFERSLFTSEMNPTSYYRVFE